MNEVPILFFLVLLTGYVLVVVVLPAFFLGILYEFAGEMEADFRRRMANVGRRFQANRAAIHNLLSESRDFPKDLDEPFGASLERYNRSIHAALARISIVEAQYRRLKQAAAGADAPGLNTAQKVRLGISWGNLWLQSLGLWYHAGQLDRETRQAGSDFTKVRDVVKRVRQEVGKALHLQQQAEGLLDNLNRLNLSGELFEKAVIEIKHLQRVSRQFPAAYCGEPAGPPASATAFNAVEARGAFQRAQTLSTQYTRLIQQFRTWQTQVAGLETALAEARQALVQLYDTHSHIPKNIDIRELVRQIIGLNRRSRDLAAITGQPDAANIPQARQAGQALTQNALALQRELEQVIQLHTRWKNVFDQAGQAINRLKDALDEQEARQETYPLRWEATREEYKLLADQLKSIDNHSYRISVEQMRKDIPSCSQILRRAEQRRASSAKKAEARRMLLGLWVDLGSVFEARWIAEKRQLDAEIRRYSAENWDSSLAVQSFLADGLHLLEDIRQVIPADKKFPIPEGQLDGWISRSQQVLSRLNHDQSRGKKIRVQLERVWEAERQSDRVLKPMLHELETTLAQFDRLTQRLKGMDDFAMQFRQELAQAKARGLALGAELNRRESGLVFDKHRDIRAWAQATANTYRQIVRSSGQQITRHREGIRRRLGELRGVALLSGDLLILNANRALALPERSYLQDIPISLDAPQTIHQMVEANSTQIEKNLVARAALKQIDDELEGVLVPVRDLAGQVQEILAEFREVLQGAQALDHGNRWPPTFIKIEAANKSFAQLKHRRDEVVRASTRADIKSNYTALRRECLAALQDLRADMRTAEVRTQTVRDSAERVQALLRAKRAMIVGYPNRPETAARAPELLRELDALNRRWLGLTGGGFRNMPYNEILRVLSELEVRLGDIQ